jgi:hypothetical protein
MLVLKIIGLLVIGSYGGFATRAASAFAPPAAIRNAQASPSVHFSHVTVTPPSGWRRSDAGGWLLLTPPDVPPGESVALEVSSGGPSNRDLAEEFAALVKASDTGGTLVEKTAPNLSIDRQGLSTITQTYQFKDAAGKERIQHFVARRNNGRFEAVVYAASTIDLAHKYVEAMYKFLDDMVFDGAPAPQPAQPAGAKVPTVANVQQPATAVAAPIRLPALAPRPGYITGRAVFEDERPIPQFHVHAAGFSGNFNPLNNNLPGVVHQTADTFGDTDGTNGQYAIQIKKDALIFGVLAQATFQFHGTEFTLNLWPTDNLADNTSPGSFRGQSSKGIVRDFVLKMDTLRPGFDLAKYPNHSIEFNRNSLRPYYGGTLDFNCTYGSTPEDLKGGLRTSLAKVYSEQSVVTVTFTPSGPRVDGVAPKTFKRSSPQGHSGFTLYGIPYGPYTATAQLTEPNGTVHTLRLADRAPTRDGFSWQQSVPIDPVHWKSRYSLINLVLYLAN